MLQFLYNLFSSITNSPYFGVLLIIWLILDVLWVSRWRELLARIATLFNKPWIFEKDEHPNDPPLYPRRILEQLAQRGGDSSSDVPKTHSASPLATWASQLRNRVFDEETPERAFGHLLFLIFFSFFLLADAISVANTLMVLKIILPGDVPDILQRFDLAVLGGALLAATVGIWLFIEISGDDSAWIDFRKMNDVQKAIIKVLSLVIAVCSIIVMIAFAIDRLIAIHVLPSTQTAQIILSAILYGLVPINSALAAAISFPEAARGAIVLIYLLVSLALLILPIFAFVVDILWRIAYICIDIIVWVVATPILIIPFGIAGLIRMVNPPPKQSSAPPVVETPQVKTPKKNI